ncbi:MAG: hypothetical protein CML30_03515 [Rhizobiales bacterium]|nr:hypothetical protein [Hyphomicrobiales bacterium]|tara:strand:- start:849 stop:1196 length:348 start_codon:yes stop_codon:yes gene_type:complete
MSHQTAPTNGPARLSDASRQRIEQLRVLFIERSRQNLAEIKALIARRPIESDPRAVDEDLIKLAHTLVGASGLFGFHDLGNTAHEVEVTLLRPGYTEAEFDGVTGQLVEKLSLIV